VVYFSDVTPEHWAYGYIKWAACQQIVGGYSDNTFRPDNLTTRGQVAKLIVGAAKWPIQLSAGAPHFSDVPADSAFYVYIETALTHGIVGGYADGTFHPSDLVTRAQVTKMLVLGAGYPLLNPATASFSDVPVGSTFYSYIETAAARQIVGGYSDGTFHPLDNTTRAQLCKMLFQIYAVQSNHPSTP
jgi:hypothetical protein